MWAKLYLKDVYLGNLLVVQWLGLHSSIAGDASSIPAQGAVELPLTDHQLLSEDGV